MTELRVRARRGADRRVLTIEVSGELDIETAPEFEAATSRYLRTGLRRLVVDLTGLTFADVAGLRAIAALRARAGYGGVTVVTSGARPQVRRLMAMLTPRASRYPAGAAFQMPPAS